MNFISSEITFYFCIPGVSKILLYKNRYLNLASQQKNDFLNCFFNKGSVMSGLFLPHTKQNLANFKWKIYYIYYYIIQTMTYHRMLIWFCCLLVAGHGKRTHRIKRSAGMTWYVYLRSKHRLSTSPYLDVFGQSSCIHWVFHILDLLLGGKDR